MSTPNSWTILGIEPTQDVLSIRRAYAAALKRTNPDEDPVGFASLRQAYEQAMARARMLGAGVAAHAPVAPQTSAAPQAPVTQVASDASRAPESSPAAEATQAPPIPPVAGAPLTQATPAASNAIQEPEAAQPSAPPASASPVPTVVTTYPAASANPTLDPTPTAAPTPTQPTDLDLLRGAFAALQQTAVSSDPPSPDALRILLDTCLESPALENLSVQLEFEPALIRFFAQTLPRTQFLLETVIAHWKWRERPRSAASAGVAALVAHADNLRRLDNLHATSPRVYSALTRPPRPWLLWAQLVLFGLESDVREALGEFRNLSPGIFDPRAQEWWSRFFNRPHIQPGLLRGAGALALVGVLIGGVAGADNNRLLAGAGAGGLAGALAGLLVTGLWLALVDWPRSRLGTTRVVASAWLRLGWAPAALGACLVSALVPDRPAMLYGAIAVAAVLATWANLMAPAIRTVSGNSLLGRIVATAVVNVPLGVWWVLLNISHVTRPSSAMTVVLGATMLTFAIGQQQLWLEFQSSLTAGARQRARAALAAVAVGLLALLLFTRNGSEDNPFLLMCMVIVVIAHRTPALNLTEQQVRIRHYLTFGPAFILARVPSHMDFPSLQWVGGMVFMIGVAASMGVTLYNDWKAAREGAPWKTTNA